MPTISVIVPVYKVEDYLSDCIDSILSQSFEDFELILVDDGSPDNCGKICDEYQKKDNRIIVIHKENGGLSDARNKGIEIARGEYLTFIDSDDLVSKNYLFILFHSIKNTNADISVCTFKKFLDNQELELFARTEKKADLTTLTGRQACLKLYNEPESVLTIACAKLYTKSIFQNLRFPEGRINEDEGTTPIALYSAEKVVFSNSTEYYYRLRSDSIMNRQFNLKRFDSLHCMQICSSYFAARNDDELYRLAENKILLTTAKLTIEAYSCNLENGIPAEFKMSVRKALSILRKKTSDDNYCWYLAKVHPKLLKPHAYIKKIKSLLGF